MKAHLSAAAAALLGLAIAVPAFAQTVPPQQKNNDASIDGAVQNTPGRTLENRTPENDARGTRGPESGETTTGSPPSAVRDSIETETGLGTLMDSDESEASRNRPARSQRR